MRDIRSLTYMSIDTHITDLKAARRLFPVLSYAPGATTRRALLVDEELLKLLLGPWDTPRTRFDVWRFEPIWTCLPKVVRLHLAICFSFLIAATKCGRSKRPGQIQGYASLAGL